jgi:hypothetical protein
LQYSKNNIKNKEMGRVCLGKWQEHQAFFFSLSQITNLSNTHFGGHRELGGIRMSLRGGGGLGIYRPEKLRALPTPLKSSGR